MFILPYILFNWLNFESNYSQIFYVSMELWNMYKRETFMNGYSCHIMQERRRNIAKTYFKSF